VTGKPS